MSLNFLESNFYSNRFWLLQLNRLALIIINLCNRMLKNNVSQSHQHLKTNYLFLLEDFIVHISVASTLSAMPCLASAPCRPILFLLTILHQKIESKDDDDDDVCGWRNPLQSNLSWSNEIRNEHKIIRQINSMMILFDRKKGE